MESILGFHHLDTDLNTERYLVVEALRIKERQDETQFTTKIGRFLCMTKLRVLVLCLSCLTLRVTLLCGKSRI
jgi:hypothetical protein